MKKITYILLSAALAVFAASCARIDHAEGLRVTYYPVLEVAGGTTVAHQVGTPWTDPGCKATLNGEDVSSQLEVSSDVNAEESGIYRINYAFTNADGFTSSTSRTVVVYDVASASSVDISGTYPNVGLQLYVPETEEYVGNFNAYCSAQKISNGPAKGLFYMQDLLGGFFAVGFGAGPSYASKALILLNADNSVSLLSATNVQGVPTAVKSGTYDPETETIRVPFRWSGNSSTAQYLYYCIYRK